MTTTLVLGTHMRRQKENKENKKKRRNQSLDHRQETHNLQVDIPREQREGRTEGGRVDSKSRDRPRRYCA